MQRVMIIGPCGAGKSTLSHELAAKLGLPLIHMDKLNWQPGWVDQGNDRLRGLLAVEVAKPRWLIEGNYGSTMPMRLARADTVIYLDYLLPLCLWRLIKRIVTFHGRTRPDMPDNCPERFDPGFLLYVLRWNHGPRQRTEHSLRGHAHKVIRLKTPRALADWLATVKSSSMRHLFATPLYDFLLDEPELLDELAHSIRSLAKDDRAGIGWSRTHGYQGYTSYASLDDLPRRDPAFAELKRLLTRHAAAFAKQLAWDVKPKLDSLWVNLLKNGGHHSGHIHPHSILSGTFYVEAPPGAGAIRFEDPRLAMMMAAPQRRADAPEQLRQFVTVEPRPGLLLLWESFLRHEVLPGKSKAERLSISFNFA